MLLAQLLNQYEPVCTLNIKLYYNGGLYPLTNSGVVDNNNSVFDIHNKYAPRTVIQCNLIILYCGVQQKEVRQDENDDNVNVTLLRPGSHFWRSRQD